MFRYEGDQGLSGPKTRQWLTLFGGVAIGAMLPKITNYFIARGMPADQAKATAEAVTKGALPMPAELESEAARLAALEKVKQSQGPAIPTWIWPVGMGVLAIALMGGKMFRRNPPRRRRWGKPTARERRAVAAARRRIMRHPEQYPMYFAAKRRRRVAFN